MNNFEFTGETKVNLLGITLFRIKAIVEIKKHNVKIGDIGGWVSGNAKVSGNAWVSGDVWVYGDAEIDNNNRWCSFSCFGSANRTTTIYTTKTGIEITCGCFKGDLKTFIAKVKETHRDSKFGREYMAMIELIKIKFNIKDSEL